MSSKSSKDSRPRIWSEGSQRPPFDFRAFGSATLMLSRDSLSELLSRCSAGAAGFGATVGTGRWRIPTHRLGRFGRYLPSAERVALWIATGSDVLAQAGQVIVPQEEVDTSTPNTLRWPGAASKPAAETPAQAVAPHHPAPAAARPSRPTAQAGDELAAIRAMFAEPDPEPAPSRASLRAAPSQVKAKPAVSDWADLTEEPPTEKTPGRLGGLVVKGAAYALGYALLALSLPVGAAMAGLAWAKGEDLRKLVEG